jgi:hypothetical protein
MTYTNASHLRVEVERILLTEWDPIGVKGNPMAEGEYLSFAGVVTTMLVGGGHEEAIAPYLEKVQSERMQIPPDSAVIARAASECARLVGD